MSRPLSQEDVLYLQRSCACCGLYSGSLSGVLDQATANAEDSLEKSGSEIQMRLGTFDARSERSIMTLIPPAQETARLMMKYAKGFEYTVRVISGTRTYTEQDALYAIGRTERLTDPKVTNAKGGQSNHNFGIAWDVGLFRPNGSYLSGLAPGDADAYRRLASMVKSKITGIEWGGDWVSFPDMPHYQLSTGRSIQEVRSLFELGKPMWRT